MALSQSVASELLEAFRAGEGVDLIRESVRLVMQELIETEASEVVGAGRYERSRGRVTERNGSRPRLVATQAGDVELRIPKLRQGSFFPVILERRRRIDQALYAVVMEAWVNGVSTRAVDDLVAALGIGSGISKSEVSPDLRRVGRAGRGVPGPAAAPHRVPVRVPRRHLPARPPHRTRRHGRRRAGHLDGRRRRDRGHRRRRPGDPRPGRRRLRGRGVLARVPPHPEAAWPARRPAGHLRPARRPRRRASAGCSKGWGINVAGSTSPATCSRWCRSRTRTWSPSVFRTAFAQPDADAAVAGVGPGP